MTDGPRLVSLCPSITETLFSIGAGPGVVGATRYCVRPKGPLRNVERVGGTKNPDVARILALAPDVVFANEEENRREDAEALRQKLRVHVSMPRTVAEVPAAVRAIGIEAGLPDAAEALAQRIEEAIPEPMGARFRFLCLIWKSPWMAAGGDTYVSDLLRLAGGVNVLESAPKRYPEVEPGEVANLRPDVLVLPSEPYPFAQKHRDAIHAAFGNVRLEFLPGDDVTWHGARTLEGLALMKGLRERYEAGGADAKRREGVG